MCPKLALALVAAVVIVEQQCGAGGPVNDTCDEAVPIPEGTTLVSTEGAATEGPAVPPGIGDCDGQGGAIHHDVWFTITASCNGYMHVTSCAGESAVGFNTKIAIYEGCACDGLAIVACSDNMYGCGSRSFAYTPVKAGQCYMIRLGAANPGLGGPVSLEVTCADTTPNGTPDEVGRWLPPEPWPAVAIHSAVLATGKVLQWASPGGGAWIWDPATDQVASTEMSSNIFCSGMSFLPDGRLIISGGTGADCDKQGRQEVNVFDPFSGAWTFGGTMSTGRWYPTSLALGDGTSLFFAGKDTHCDPTPKVERYAPGTGPVVMPGAERLMNTYPRLHLLTSGRIAHVGTEAFTMTLDPATEQWADVAPTSLGERLAGNSVLLPGRTDQVMIIGGKNGGVATATCETIDFAEPEPSWQWAPPLAQARTHANAVLLPDATVLVVGGGTEGLFEQPIRTPELYDPDTATWSDLPPHVFGRMYHSTAVLLPDGRVLAAGQNFGPSASFGEIYEPAYLHRGVRPVIDGAPARIGYGLPFDLQTDQAAAIASAVLMAPSTVTHSVDNSQRHVGLAFRPAEGHLEMTAPASPNHAQPGYYMLFILDGDGVPSEAAMVQLLPAGPGDLDGNGVVDVLDLIELLVSWGPCPDCPADLDGDGVVGVPDLIVLITGWG